VVLVKATIRVKIPKAAGPEPEQILILIKAYIPRAVAVRVLHSGDVKVTLPNQQAKD
jgi:hypothetical protein